MHGETHITTFKKVFFPYIFLHIVLMIGATVVVNQTGWSLKNKTPGIVNLHKGHGR